MEVVVKLLLLIGKIATSSLKSVSNLENDVDNVKSELDRYLDESLLPRTEDLNILQW